MIDTGVPEIKKALHWHFLNHDYKLYNTYIYDWESDFFCVSKSGYAVEVEIKVSRGDFLRDFIKEKHGLFKDICSGKSHHIYIRNDYHNRGDFLGRIEYKTLHTSYGPEQSTRGGRKDHNWRWGRKENEYGYWVNDYGHIELHKKSIDMYAPTTGIKIKPIAEIQSPNKIWYAVPEGLITLAEVPPYAGLLYIGKDAKVIKQAPFMHKTKHDLDKILLKKYYNLWNYKTPLEERLSAVEKTESEKN